MFVIGTLPYQTYDYGYDRYLAAAQAREARLRDQLQRQILLDNLLAQHAGYDGGWSYPPTARGCPRYPHNHVYDAPYTDSYLAPYEHLAERRARERQEALDKTLRQREARLKEWKQQQRARRDESAASQTVGTFDIDDRNTSTEVFVVVQKPGSSSSQHQSSSATPSASQPTTINIDVADTKGKSKEDTSLTTSVNETESGSDMDITVDPRAIQTSLSAIGEIGALLAKLENDFMFPHELDFEPSSRSENTSELHLAYTSRNAPLRYYDHALQELLSNLDAVPSYGSKAVRDARRGIVARVEKVLEQLEEQIEERKEVALWKMQKASSTAAVETESVADRGSDLDAAGTETKSDDAINRETSANRSETSTIDGDDVGFDAEKKAVHPQTPVSQLDAAAVNGHNIDGVEETKTDVVTAEDSSELLSPSEVRATLAFDGDAVITGAEDETSEQPVADEETILPSLMPLAATLLPSPGSPRSHVDALSSEFDHDIVTTSASSLTGDDSLSASKPEELTLPALTFAVTSESPLFDPAVSTDVLHSTAEESDVDESLLALSPPSLTIPVHSEADEDGVLVEVPGHEHDQEEDVWVDVQA